MDAFVSGAGTGGTIAGVSCYLKQRRPGVQVFLIDPPGSSLYNKVGSICCLPLQGARLHGWGAQGGDAGALHKLPACCDSQMGR